MNWMVIAVMVNSVSFVHEIEQEEDIVTVFLLVLIGLDGSKYPQQRV